MQRAAASRRSYTRAIFRTHAHLADEAAGILVAGGALGCAVAGMKLPRAREQKTVALEAYFDAISASDLSRLKAHAGAGRDARGRRASTAPRDRIVDPGWSTLWMKRFGPFRVGRRILIVPPWKRASEPRPLDHRGPAGASVRHRTPSDDRRRIARARVDRRARIRRSRSSTPAPAPASWQSRRRCSASATRK